MEYLPFRAGAGQARRGPLRLHTNRHQPQGVRDSKSWLEAPATELLAVTRADVDQALAWLNEAGSGGNLTTDAQIAAVARRCQARVHTADTDFARFPGVRWKNPVL